MTDVFTLADGFQDPDMSAWQDLAQKALKGASLDRLTAKTYDDIAIKPLYTAADVDGTMPHPPAPARDPFLPWDIRQTVLDADPKAANQIALFDLERGVSSIEFCIDPTGELGVAATSDADFALLTRGILTSLATIALDAPATSLQAAQALAAAIAPSEKANAKIAFNLDPIGQVKRSDGTLTLGAAIGFAQASAASFPHATALRADGRLVHEGGGSDAQELAFVIASGLAYLKAGETAGLTPAQLNQTLLFTLATGPDVVMEIAKLKAARRLWARVLEACDVHAPMNLQAVTSARMYSVVDPWTNILRATCAAFGAGAGGADVITVLPFTSAYGVADEHARRIARNTQLILQEETHLGRVADPAAGAWAMEALAEDLAKVAWGLVQEIERAGGIEAALTVGLVQDWVATTRAKRQQDIARRKSALVGVSIFPNLAEVLPAHATNTSSPTEADRGKSPQADGGNPPQSAALTAPPEGEQVASTSSPSEADRGKSPQGDGGGIPPMRLAAPFEALRAKPNGTIFLATLGPIAKFSARSGFAKNAFEAGGIKALGGEEVYPGDQAIVAAFTKSGAKIACLCGDDDTYQSRAAPLAQALKHEGAKAVWLAGKGSFQSVDRTIFAGADILAELTFAHQILEGAA